MQRAASVAAFVAVALSATSCGSLSPNPSAAAQAATAFRSDVQRSDGAAACGLLAPETRHEVVQSAGKPCAIAILHEGVSGGRASPVHVDAYGQAARVVYADDVVFLADFPAGWRLTAAGCTARVDRPYDCSLKGS
jgi:hypothetical protein